MPPAFITQRGPYADLTSVLNGADHLTEPRDLYVAFADNLYPGGNPWPRCAKRHPVTPPC